MANATALNIPIDGEFLERMEAHVGGLSDPVEQLRQALAKNEFELFFQPILALSSADRYPMAEILVRMREEERALLPPGEFLPVLEHYGMMPHLDRWVVSRVVERLARGSRMARFTINVAGQTLQEPHFAIHVANEMRKAGVSPACLLFEIDEADVLAQLDAAARFAAAVKGLGCGVMIDGFGHRAIKFTPLKVLRVDYVKIDGSIVRNILRSEVARMKLDAMLRVADVLSIGLVAECVEDQDILARLKALNVSHAQGFGVHEPHPLDSLAAPGAVAR